MINDKFFLGGPNPLRGFRTHGVGPTGLRPNNKGHDFLGADILLNATTAISLDFPSAVFTRLGLHGHGFACAGNLVPLSTVSSTMGNPRQLASDFLSTMRYSAGVGIVSCSKWLGRIEVIQFDVLCLNDLTFFSFFFVRVCVHSLYCLLAVELLLGSEKTRHG